MGFFLKVQMYRLGKVVEWGGKLLPGKGGGVGWGGELLPRKGGGVGSEGVTWERGWGGVGWGVGAYLGGKVPTVEMEEILT